MSGNPVKILNSQSALMETEYGSFKSIGFNFDDGTSHILLYHGHGATPLVRIQSHCLTSTAFRSTMCDCRNQIEASMKAIIRHEFGVLVYLDQEARGHGIVAKMKVMSNLNSGLSLRDAQIASGHGDDVRSYSYVPIMLSQIGVLGEIDLLTENIGRLELLRQYNIYIRNLVPLTTEH